MHLFNPEAFPATLKLGVFEQPLTVTELVKKLLCQNDQNAEQESLEESWLKKLYQLESN